MVIQSLRGFRDFYPEEQAKISYLRAKIAETCGLFGFEEFEGPALEAIDLYAAKSSEEIVNEQAFVFEDRGGDKITLRPELTPTLARMIAAKQNQLTFPVRWWSFGRFWRYERPQKGRGREFYQWNLDILGDNTVQSDVEILEVIITFLKSLGVTAQDVVFEISDRAFVTQQLSEKGIAADKTGAAFRFLDRMDKLTLEEQAEYGQKVGLTDADLQVIRELCAPESNAWQQCDRLVQIMDLLKAKGLDGWAKPELAIVRGFAYYTGMVFEVRDRVKEFRALFGGGRYSNLVGDVGGSPLDGIGMGMGDMTMTDFLTSKNLLPDYAPAVQVCLVSLKEPDAYVSGILSDLRDNAFPSLLIATEQIGKGLKFASNKGAQFAAIIGPNETNTSTVTLKNLLTGEQETMPSGELINYLKK